MTKPTINNKSCPQEVIIKPSDNKPTMSETKCRCDCHNEKLPGHEFIHSRLGFTCRCTQPPKPSDYQEVDTLPGFYKKNRNADYDKIDGFLRRELATMGDRAHFTFSEFESVIDHIIGFYAENLHSELDRVREETIKACVKALPKKILDKRGEGFYEIEGWNDAIEEAQTALTQLAKDNK